MANMSYCRFQNTSQDLNDCANALGTALEEGLTFEQFYDELSKDEQDAYKRILKRAKEFLDMHEELLLAEPIEDR